jgi:lysozyme family protein
LPILPYQRLAVQSERTSWDSILLHELRLSEFAGARKWSSNRPRYRLDCCGFELMREDFGAIMSDFGVYNVCANTEGFQVTTHHVQREIT